MCLRCGNQLQASFTRNINRIRPIGRTVLIPLIRPIGLATKTSHIKPEGVKRPFRISLSAAMFAEIGQERRSPISTPVPKTAANRVSTCDSIVLLALEGDLLLYYAVPKLVKQMKMTDVRNQKCVEFDSKVLSLPAIKKAAYTYLNAFVCDITIQGDVVRCVLGFAPTTSEEARAGLVDDFKKEVLDQDLRETLKAETEPVRNLILAHAFSRTGIVSNEQVSDH